MDEELFGCLAEVAEALAIGFQCFQQVATAFVVEQRAEGFAAECFQLRIALNLEEKAVDGQVAEVKRLLLAQAGGHGQRLRRFAVGVLPIGEIASGPPYASIGIGLRVFGRGGLADGKGQGNDWFWLVDGDEAAKQDDLLAARTHQGTDALLYN